MEQIHKQKILNYFTQHIKLSYEEEEMVLGKLKYTVFLKNEYIGTQGEVARVQSFILKGGARMFMLDDEGVEHTVQIGLENWWMADLGSFITQSPADYSIQCFEKTEVLQLAYADLQDLYHLVPKMDRFYRIIIQNAYVSAQKRIVNKTMLPAKERYLEFRTKYPEMEQRVPQYMIASYLGITKEFLSKIRGQLAAS